jgi:hypothetical protein
MNFTNEEAGLLVEALRHRAARHESESRYKPQSAKPHDLKAMKMRKLAARIAEQFGVGATVAAALFAVAIVLGSIAPVTAQTSNCRTNCYKAAGITTCHTSCD